MIDKPKLCVDHDEDCPSIFAEGYCLECWLHDPARGFCPYLRSTGSENETERSAVNTLPDTPLGRAFGEPAQAMVNDALRRLGNNTPEQKS